ncbi:chromatin assembly factor 1 subunit A-B-like [Rana temporaria]|uniref:chromatin assembly factor 1 subunit A-B-like n=1 Tax=Rana temporaria TaxID=8407 RepID=UPI001AACFE73|nr:chromatin assembly factor 1 subunit A-B-like [Rana temporaria]
MESPFTQEEVLSTIKALKLGSSPGPDGFSTGYYKKFGECLAPHLTRLFNSLRDGARFGTDLNSAYISVIPKPDKDPSEVCNYRPISLINNDIKIMTKMLANRLSSFIPSYIHKDQPKNSKEATLLPLDVVRVLRAYLSATAPFRRSDSLYMSVNGPEKGSFVVTFLCLHFQDEDDEDPKEEDEEDDDDDDGFFVPHGYLSEDEGGVSDEECKNPENQKVRQKLKAKEWDELQTKGRKINVIKPILIGCVWLGGSTEEIPFLQKFSACVLDMVIPIEEEMVLECNSSRRLEDREILMHLLPLLHGNVNGSKIIIKEFQECCRRGIISLGDGSNIAITESTSPNACHQMPSSFNIPSKARLKRIISENSMYEKRPDHRLCWYVHSDILKSFQQDSLPVPCQWIYITQLNLPSRDEIISIGGQTQATPSSGKRKSAGSMPITKFMKKATIIGSLNNITVTEARWFPGRHRRR